MFEENKTYKLVPDREAQKDKLKEDWKKFSEDFKKCKSLYWGCRILFYGVLLFLIVLVYYGIFYFIKKGVGI